MVQKLSIFKPQGYDGEIIDIDFLAFGKLTLALTLTVFRFNVNGVKTHQSLPVLSIIKGNAPSSPYQNQKNDASVQFTCYL